MQRGTDIHAEGEHYLKTGKIRDSKYTEAGLNYRPYVESLKPHLPPPMHDELIVEQPIELWTPQGVLWVGFIDIGFSGVDPLLIRDIKTTSDFRYAKTEKELKENIQLISYGKWVYEATPYDGDIDLGHIYLKTEKKVVRKKPLSKVVNVVLDKSYIEDFWDREMNVVEQMIQAAKAESMHDLEPNPDSCSMYPPHGCPFREECGFTAEMSLAMRFQQNKDKEKNMGNAFLDKLKKKKEAAGSEAPEKKKKTKAKTPDDGQIVPDDAPPRETSEEESDKIRAEAEEKKEKAEKAAAKKESKKKTTKKKATNGAGFTLYIDCMPKKDVNSDGIEPTLFEDWFSPLIMSMNDTVMEEKKLPSYLLLPYSEEKAMVQIAVKDAVEKGLPPSMIISSGVPGAKDALSVLTPHATTVITGIRG